MLVTQSIEDGSRAVYKLLGGRCSENEPASTLKPIDKDGGNMKITYMEKEEYKIEPVDKNGRPIGFNVLNEETKEIIFFDTLYKAEYYIKDNVKDWG
jgi:hypothetical protein